MTNEEVRVQALGAALTSNPGGVTVNQLIEDADRIARFIMNGTVPGAASKKDDVPSA